MNHIAVAQLCQQQATHQENIKSLSEHTQIAPETLNTLFQSTVMPVIESLGPWWGGTTFTKTNLKPTADNAGIWG